MAKAPKKRGVYLIHLITSVALILLAQAYEAGNDNSRSSANRSNHKYSSIPLFYRICIQVFLQKVCRFFPEEHRKY